MFSLRFMLFPTFLEEENNLGEGVFIKSKKNLILYFPRVNKAKYGYGSEGRG